MRRSAQDAAKQTAETARKAPTFLSFWTFMALLFGAVAQRSAEWSAQLRDENLPSVRAPAMS